MEKEQFYKKLKSVPKAEVHLHIEAVPTIKTIQTLYQKYNNEQMTDSQIAELFSYSDLNGFIQSFLKIQALYKCPKDFDYIFSDLETYLLENNIIYTEAFFAPTAFLKNGFDYSEMVKIFDEKIAQIKEKHGITIKLLMDVSRTFGCENAMNNLNLLKKYPSPNIIGIGLGGAEVKGPAKEYEPVYAQAIKDGLKVVAHAGEDVGPESIWDSLNYLHIQRIGHGISAIQDEKLMEVLKEKQIPLEVCPTSNVFTKKYVNSISSHPIKEFYKKGLFVTVNTDDPVFFKTTLTEEYWKLYNECDFSLEDIKILILKGFEALFISEGEKQKYYTQVENSWKE